MVIAYLLIRPRKTQRKHRKQQRAKKTEINNQKVISTINGITNRNSKNNRLSSRV